MAKPDPVTAYARAVVKGTVPAGLLHVAACRRHLSDLDARRSLGLTWDVTAATRIIEFYPTALKHYKGEWAGQPLTLEPWQQFILGSLCGWKRDGLRRFRSAFVEVPRGNGKSTIVAGLALYLGFLEGEPGAESYAIATKRDQARIVWETARQMVLRTKALSARIHAGAHTLYADASASKFQPLGADSDTLDGLRPHIVIADEVHAHKDASLIDVMQTGMGTRRQPLLFEITTAGINRHGPWWVHREYTRLMLDGLADDDAWFGLIASADPDDDWTQPETWAKANPNYNKSVKVDDLRTKCKRAQAMPIFEGEFRRLHVGQLVQQEAKVLSMEGWRAGERGALSLEDYRGRQCFCGLDLASTTDLTAFVLLFPEGDGRYTVFPQFWIPEANIEARVQRDRVPFHVWAQAGHITLTPGNITDFDIVRRDILRLCEGLDVRVIGVDPSNSTQIVTQIAGELGSDACLLIPQGFRNYNDATNRLIALVAAGKIQHGGNPVLAWCADNLTVRRNTYGEIRPDKHKATERIDGMVALLMALSRALLDDASVYEDQGLILL